MSGSPIYLGDELAAVLSYAIPDADPHYGYATPAVFLEPLLATSPRSAAWLPPLGLPVSVAARDPLGGLLWSGIGQPAAQPAGNLRPGHAVGVQLARGAIHVTTSVSYTHLDVYKRQGYQYVGSQHRYAAGL